MKMLLFLVMAFCAAMPLVAEWADISAAIAAREAEIVPDATGESSEIEIGQQGGVTAPVEYVADGRTFDSFFWHEAFSSFFTGITYKRHPGLKLSFK